ncbi:hypothetical protein RIF29_12233 [Crotalaria pallida]|uniref:Sugar phosphate transporter domain-containing protein n=1 Tax=Crotalaria pallida TaxID=3830 RepID=A0AAN9IN79_CROPI
MVNVNVTTMPFSSSSSSSCRFRPLPPTPTVSVVIIGIQLDRISFSSFIHSLAMDIRGDADTGSFSSLFAAVSYGISSMAMVFINKAVLMQYSHSMTLLTLQQLATALLIHFGRRMGYTKARGVDMATAKRLLPVSIFYNANVAFALASLKGVNIPMYIAIKRLTPLAVLIAGFFYGKGKPTTQVTLSVMLIAAGVLIAALGDFSFDLFGYSMAFISVFFQTMYLVLVERSGAEDGLSSVEIMFYNSFLSLPFLMFLIIATGEFPDSLSILFAKSYSFSFLVILVISLVMGIVLNFTMFLCTVVNSALTTTIVGVLKGVGSTTLGFVLLGGVQVRALNVTGLVINTAGGVWYSYAKYQQKISKTVKQIPDVEAHRK